MAFMSFDTFLYAKTDLRVLTIKEIILEKKENFFYKIKAKKDKLNSYDESFIYSDKNPDIFKENDEIIISNLGKKIILFNNYSNNYNNFKKAKKIHLLNFAFLCFLNIFFIILAILNHFNMLNCFLILLGFLLLTMNLINLLLLNKQIYILQNYSQEKIKYFLEEKLKNS
ncbi:hypothetical protein JG676_00485 [Campylobacter sp. 2018MI35]|uniref:hypothetical protein n=1 Tax=Campylobacter sp. 2018MI34 TaxID=2800582 RepID=UPI00190622A7|nr:hypothetical protein [Campylobacter sp. 2018MI34]MBK1991100.1 hypothetical protein [Campylobacter sp. 2018MI34]